jgi:hypothetical protein
MNRSKSNRGSFSALAVPNEVITAAQTIELWAKRNHIPEIRILNVTFKDHIDPSLPPATPR